MAMKYVKAIWRNIMSRTRTAIIRTEGIPGTNDTGTNGPDSMFVVDLLENGQVIESRRLPGKSKAYANDVVENWESGLIQLLID
jgi:hypothetical protein